MGENVVVVDRMRERDGDDLQNGNGVVTEGEQKNTETNEHSRLLP